jgi:AcrR family transcriptional regulator
MGRPKTIENDELLGVAREVFLADGAAGSTRDIAARAGISEAALFKRFFTKKALFLAAMTPTQPDVEGMIRKAEAQKDPRGAFHVLAKEVLGYFRMAIPRMLPVITHPAIGMDELLRHFGESPAEKLLLGISNYLKDQGRRPADALAAAGVLVSTLHSIALFELMGIHGGAVPDSAVNGMVEVVWRGAAQKAKSGRRRGK